ncbi:GAF domain-containing protein [candidate division KSB1 bacterium]|nr:GAF domain-containing protein [candidate division KSB1 bacterium]
MPLFSLINLLGFGFGTALAIIIFSLTLKKSPKEYDDYTLVILLIACAFWFGGNFFSLLLHFLFGNVLLIEKNILFFSYIGMAVIPSALLHALAAFFHRAKIKSRSLLLHALFIGLIYLPFVVFLYAGMSYNIRLNSLHIVITESFKLAFYIWMLLAIGFSIIISENLARTHEIEADRHFYRDISISLAIIWMGIIIIYIIPSYKLSYVGRYLNLFMLLSPVFPLGILAYYVYRYNFYRLVVKPSLVYSVIYGTLMAVYLLGIRRLGEYLKQFPDVNSTLIEGILLIALVFAFQPFREAFQTRLDKIFFRDRYFYQQILRELSDTIIGTVDLEKLLNTISEALTSAFKVKSLTMVVFQLNAKKPEIYRTVGHPEFKDFLSLINAFSATRKLRLRQQIKNHRVIAALAQNNLELAVPIFYRNKMMGLVCLSEKQTGNAYSEDEIDMLQTFSNQIALAVENARLVQERLNLEARVYQSEKLNSLGQMATTMSHEIKNPLSSIKSIIQVLREKAAGEVANDLDVVIVEINRLNSILEKLLSFARPSEGRIESVSIPEIIKDVIGLLKYQANKSQIKINYSEPGINAVIKAKKQSVREIIFNLVLNALQSITNHGEINISLENQKTPGKLKMTSRRIDFYRVKNWYILTVKDNGPGISAENLNYIFDPFFTTKTVGTGLGLSIVKQNVEEAGGFINIKSELNKGTEFSVYFPNY